MSSGESSAYNGENFDASHQNILITGGTGYIGAHVAVECIASGYQVIIVDNLSNSSSDVLQRLKAVTGVEIPCYFIDVADREMLGQIFKAHSIDSVIHCAGFKSAGVSIDKPLQYYRNNIDTTLTLLETMEKYGCKRMVFTSSAAVYGSGSSLSLAEDMCPEGITTPYGRTKQFIEQILKDAAYADRDLSVVMLRCFNPAGAHESGLLGELPSETPNNLMTNIAQTACGLCSMVSVFGGDYPTTDGTCVRDYIHVLDLAQGILAALRYAEKHSGAEIFNLGTGTGRSILELIHAFETVNQLSVPYKIVPRRLGDVVQSVAATEKAARLLHWKPEKTLADICRDAWRWQQYISLEGRK